MGLLKTLYLLRNELVLVAAQEQKELPRYRFDGEEADVKEVSLVLRIPIEEAAVRLLGPDVLRGYRYKNVHGGQGSHSVQIGIGTTIHDRAQAFVARRTRKLPKRRKRKNDDSSKGK